MVWLPEGEKSYEHSTRFGTVGLPQHHSRSIREYLYTASLHFIYLKLYSRVVASSVVVASVSKVCSRGLVSSVVLRRVTQHQRNLA